MILGEKDRMGSNHECRETARLRCGVARVQPPAWSQRHPESRTTRGADNSLRSPEHQKVDEDLASKEADGNTSTCKELVESS
jgi:hypothetical protein